MILLVTCAARGISDKHKLGCFLRSSWLSWGFFIAQKRSIRVGKPWYRDGFPNILGSHGGSDDFHDFSAGFFQERGNYIYQYISYISIKLKFQYISRDTRKYGGWKKSYTTLDGWNAVNNGMFTIYQLAQGFASIRSISSTSFLFSRFGGFPK